jgi:hypothetical protein
MSVRVLGAMGRLLSYWGVLSLAACQCKILLYCREWEKKINRKKSCGLQRRAE